MLHPHRLAAWTVFGERLQQIALACGQVKKIYDPNIRKRASVSCSITSSSLLHVLPLRSHKRKPVHPLSGRETKCSNSTLKDGSNAAWLAILTLVTRNAA